MDNSSLELRHDYQANRLSWHVRTTGQLVDDLIVPSTPCGCAIEQFHVSPSGNWIVTARWSGQGEWGYDVVRSHPLERMAGITERKGYILDLPGFSADESYLVGGYGESWIGGWWAHVDDDCFTTAARGGNITFGWLFRHTLPWQEVTWHELRMNLPPGWFPRDPEDEKWMGARSISPIDNGGVRLLLPGEIPFECAGPLASVIDVPVRHPSGGRLL